MKDEKMNYWQVAAGDGSRDYSDLFLDYGIMIMGSGDPGPYFEKKDFYTNKKLYASSDISKFAEEVKEGDVVVLKKPQNDLWEVLAIGIVKGEYAHLPIFEDVEGWCLQHCRYVEWKQPKKKTAIPGLSRGTFRAINSPSTILAIDKIRESELKSLRAKDLPTPVDNLTDEDLIDILIDNGLRPSDAEDLTLTINRIRRLVKWYHSKQYDISEHEARTFLIVPLLLALGWPEQKLKIEWNKIDIAFFNEPYVQKNDECIMILESKRLWAGLGAAETQASSYACNYPKCDKMIVSDGCCYNLFKRKGTKWKLSAYLNILKPKTAHPYKRGVDGADAVFLTLMEK
jgi:hypothetical protein